ncbi:MAG: hydrogenase expression/formation protein HypE [Gemmatimonadota bacterium]|jgi:hydrogenase expression/formation protein HypE
MTQTTLRYTGPACPIPTTEYPTIQLAHGGGALSRMLVHRLFLPAFHNDALAVLHDGAVLGAHELARAAGGGWPMQDGGRLALTTDSFVVKPLFFPGGDIGSLAVHGTLNDLAMCAARPVALTTALVIEEGLAMDDLWRVIDSMRRAADAAGVPVVTGDTKVVERGKGDGLFINTTGLGVVPTGISILPARARAGDAILLSGPIAMHGITILSMREGLELETRLESDSADLGPLVRIILAAGGDAVHVLRDPTRGGVASALCEIASDARIGMLLDERAVPVLPEVRGACELLGLDPLYVANEGKCIAIVAPEAQKAVLDAMRRHPRGISAAVVGRVTDQADGRVVVRSSIGDERILEPLSGEQLPRIC